MPDNNRHVTPKIEDPEARKDLRFEYLIPEFARPDFKLPSEEDKEREWAIIGTIFQGSKLIDPEKVKAHMKGNKPMDEELFTKEIFKRLTEPEEEAALDDARAKLREHLDAIRKTQVTLRKGPHE